jgi:hypothetical protein
MKPTKEQKSNEEIIPAVDVELNDEQLDVVAGGGIIDDIKAVWDGYWIGREEAAKKPQ